MSINKLLQGSTISPGERASLTKAYKETLHCLGLVDRYDPLSLFVARAVVEIGKTGVSDPAEISRRVIKTLNIH
jgi:hypothetical protein